MADLKRYESMRAVGTFPNKDEAEAALNDLRSSNFPMDRVSILAKDRDRSEQIDTSDMRDRSHDRGDNESQEGAGIGAVAGTVLGGIGGLLVGLEALIIPGVGPFLAAGTIATTLAGAGIGAAAGSLIGALTGAGIPEEDARDYSRRIEEGSYLIMVEGTEDEINRAGSILRNRNIRNWNVYDVEGRRREYNQVNTTPVVELDVERYETRPVTRYEDNPVVVDTDRDEVVEIIDKRDREQRL
jgi:uncharacterized membrane protein